MDIAGVALSVPGVLHLLLNTALDGYKIYAEVRALDGEFQEYQDQLLIQHKRLRTWAVKLNPHFDAKEGITKYFENEPQKLVLFANTLVKISEVFEDVEKMETMYMTTKGGEKGKGREGKEKEWKEKEGKVKEGKVKEGKGKYGEETTGNAGGAIGRVSGRKDFWDRNLGQKVKQLFVRPKNAAIVSSIASATIKTPSGIYQDPTLQHLLPLLEKGKALSESFKSNASFCRRLAWALYDKDKLNSLIGKLRGYNDGLGYLAEGYLARASAAGIPGLCAGDTKSPKRYFMVPLRRNREYIGESQLKRFVEDKWKEMEGEADNVTVALHGLGGAGKTQDALAFVYSCKHSHSIFWVHCGSPAQFDEDYRKLAKFVKLPGLDESDPKQDVKGIVKDWLESEESGDWVLVLDNADNKLDFFSGNDGNSATGLINYIPQTSKGAIVLTTRDYEVACQLAGPSGVLKKEAMGPSDAAALFKQLYPSVSTFYDEDRTMELLQELQFLPLAVTQVASYLEMNRSMITPSEYLRTFKRTKEDQRRLLSKAAHNSWRSDKLRTSQNDETVLTTFSITFQQIQNQSPLAYLILRTIACIDSRGIPRELLATLDGADDDIQLGEALAKLQNFSLLHKATTNDFTGDSYTVHSLVHLAIQFSLTFEENNIALAEAAQSLAQILPLNGDFEYWPTWHVYLSHATTFMQNLGDYSERDIIEIAEICCCMADYFLEIARYTEAEALARRSVRIHIALLGEKNLDTAVSMRTLALIYELQNKFEKAEQLLSKVIEVRESLLGYEHEDVQNIIMSLSEVIQAQGRRKEAEDLQVKVVENCHRIFGAKHRQTFFATSVLGLTYQQQGRYEEAGEILKKIENCDGVLGEEQLFPMARLASMYLEQGQGEKAEELYAKLLAIRQRELGKEHPDTLRSMVNLAFLYRRQRRYIEAEALYTKTLEIRQRVLGEEHPDTIDCMEDLAFVYRLQERHKEVEELYTKLLAIQQQKLGKEHPDTIDCMEDLAVIYRLQERQKEAEELYTKLLAIQQRKLGKEHPDTLSSTANLARVYEGQGRYEEAEELYTKLLAIQQRVLGEEHPDTLWSTTGLASVYVEQDRYEEAEALCTKVVEIRQRELGEEHPDTIFCMDLLSIITDLRIGTKKQSNCT